MFLLDPLSALISVIERANQQVKQVQGNKEQCQLLVTRLSHIRNILPQTDAEKARVQNQRYTQALACCRETAQRCLQHIETYAGQGYFKRLYKAGSDKDTFIQLNRQIDESQQLLITAISVHQVLEEQNQTQWKAQMLQAQQHDHVQLMQRMVDIEGLMREQLKTNMKNLVPAQQESLKVAQEEALQHQLHQHKETQGKPGGNGAQTSLEMADLVFEGLLAEGSFGSVYAGQWKGKSVAIKRINELTEATRDELIREVKIMRRLNHAVITPFHGACLAQGFECLVMQRMEQGTLSEYLSAQPALSFEQRHGMVMRLLEGVVYLHRQGVIHRDLKAANILVHDNQLYIGDFGLAKLKHSISVQTLKNLTVSDVSCAPELMDGATTTDKMDIYSVGWLIWHILSGEPWPKSTLKMEPPSLDTLHPDYQEIIQQCWSTQPEQRLNATALLEKCRNIRTPELLFTEGQQQEARSNYAGAEKLFKQAANLGHAKAAYSVGMLHANKHVPFDKDILLNYLTQSADAQYYRAQYNLARVYEKGELAEADPDKAFSLYRAVVENPATPAEIYTATNRKITQLSMASGVHTPEVNALRG